MSGEQDIPKIIPRNPEDDLQEGQVVIDAIHGRFRRIDNTGDPLNRWYVRCDDCNCEVPWDHIAIRNHFNKSHVSRHNCVYCKGKAFIYKIIRVNADVKTTEEAVYHQCTLHKPDEIDASSSLNEENLQK